MKKVKLKFSFKSFIHLLYYVIIFCLVLHLISGLLFVPNMGKKELSINTEVTELGDDSYYCTVDVVNNTDKVLGNVTIEHLAPIGYKVKDRLDTAFLSDKLEVGEDLSFSYELVKDEKGTGSIPFHDMRKDRLQTLVYVLVGGLSVLVLIMFCIRKRKVVMIGSLVSLYVLCTTFNIIKQSKLDTSVISEHVYAYEHGIKERVTFTEYRNQNYYDKWNDRFPDGVITYVNNIKDTDGDGLTDYEELCITFTNQFSKYTKSDVSDLDWDRDGDGMCNYEEIIMNTNPLVPDLALAEMTGSDEEVGTLYCLSYMPTDLYNMGHSCLFFKASKDITLDTSHIYVGNGVSVLPDGTKVSLSAGDYASFGNFITTQQIADVDHSGVFCNADIYSVDSYFGAVNYLKVTSMPVSEKAMNAVLNYFNRHHWYNLYTNNCTTMAYGAWNEAAKIDGNTDRMLDGGLYKWLFPMRISELSPLRFIYNSFGYHYAYNRHTDVPLCLCFDMNGDKSVSDGKELYADIKSWVQNGGLNKDVE